MYLTIFLKYKTIYIFKNTKNKIKIHHCAFIYSLFHSTFKICVKYILVILSLNEKKTKN